jgi:hypothetical protein
MSTLEQKFRGRILQLVMRDGEAHSTRCGDYVSPWARSILEEHEVDGFMLACSSPVRPSDPRGGISSRMDPHRFTFGVAEPIDLYQQHYATFAQLFDMDFGRYIVESDQGSALSALCARHDQIDLICLQHFLLSLKKSEFTSLAVLQEEEFRAVMDQKRRGLLISTLNQAGSNFVDGTILIADERRFKAVSMWTGVGTRMPSTTNSFEATYGHLNDPISRRNPFWVSTKLLYDAIADKTIDFDGALAHTFRTAFKRCKRRGDELPAGR